MLTHTHCSRARTVAHEHDFFFEFHVQLASVQAVDVLYELHATGVGRAVGLVVVRVPYGPLHVGSGLHVSFVVHTQPFHDTQTFSAWRLAPVAR